MKRLTEKELSKRWGISARTLQTWRTRGSGPAFIRIGERSIFYREEDVLAYEEASLVGSPPPEPEGWRDAMKRSAGAFDLLARQAKTAKAKDTLTALRDELRALIA